LLWVLGRWVCLLANRWAILGGSAFFRDPIRAPRATRWKRYVGWADRRRVICWWHVIETDAPMYREGERSVRFRFFIPSSDVPREPLSGRTAAVELGGTTQRQVSATPPTRKRGFENEAVVRRHPRAACPRAGPADRGLIARRDSGPTQKARPCVEAGARTSVLSGRLGAPGRLLPLFGAGPSEGQTGGSGLVGGTVFGGVTRENHRPAAAPPVVILVAQSVQASLSGFLRHWAMVARDAGRILRQAGSSSSPVSTRTNPSMGGSLAGYRKTVTRFGVPSSTCLVGPS